MRANKSGADRSPKTEATELEFREALGRFATGVTIVTVRGSGGRPYGLTVNAFSSLSLQPLLVLICLDNSLTEIDSFTAGRLFGVNILSPGARGPFPPLRRRGERSLAGPLPGGKTGVPILEGARASLECRVREKLPGGDHAIVVGEVARITLAQEEGEPLLFYEGRYRRLAPTEDPAGDDA